MRRWTVHLFVVAVVIVGSLGGLAPPAHAASPPFPVAHFVSPVIGSANIGQTEPFQWTASPVAAMYYVMVGTSPGNGDLFGRFVAPPQTTMAIPPLPAGRALWARIWTEVAGQGWFYGEDVTFTILPARFTNPVAGASRLMTQPFSWTAAPGATTYYLMVGAGPGTGDIFGAFVPSSQTTYTTPPLPSGRIFWARIWTSMGSFGWYYGPDIRFTT